MKKFLSLILSVLILTSICVPAFAAEEPDAYQELFTPGSILDISIEIPEEDLQDMYDYAVNEEYHSATITINGITVENAGIRTKGNMTLSNVAKSDSDRYSFRIKFDKYVKKQTLLGLDELVLNSGYTDPSYMREYLHYEILREMRMDVPETAFCSVSINEEPAGFYLAIEALDDAFLESHFGADYESGNFYKMEEGSTLVYREDEDYSYAELKAGEDDDLDHFKAFVKNLNAVPDGEKGNLESFLDVDSALIYTAANTVLCNYDSYSGNRHHNFYLYENEDGIFKVVPWDFNMSFGGYNSNSQVGIDTPFISGSLETLPMIGKLLAVEEYRERYYGYIQEIMGLLENFEERVADVRNLIGSYVKDDPTAFYTYEEFDRATTRQNETGVKPENRPEGKPQQQPAEPGENKNPAQNGAGHGGGQMFGGSSSIINCISDRLDNLNAQFAGTAERSTETGGNKGQNGGNKGQNTQNGGGKPNQNGQENAGGHQNFLENRPEGFGNLTGGGKPGGMHGGQSTPVSDAIRVHVDGHIVDFTIDPVTEGGTTLVECDAILDALGAEIQWNGTAVTAVKGEKTILLTIGSKTAYVDGEAAELPAALKTVGNTVIVPVRFLAEQFGFKVSWTAESHLIALTSK